jgi:hypothetical protein
MDLTSRDGNAFGLNQTLRPTMTDMRDRFDDPAIRESVRDMGAR